MPPSHYYLHIITLFDSTQISLPSRVKLSKEDIDNIKAQLNFKLACYKSIQEDEEFFRCSVPIVLTEPENLPQVPKGES